MGQADPHGCGEGKLSTLSVAHLFFNHVVHNFGVSHVVLNDWDPQFTS